MREGWVTKSLGDISLVGAGNSAPQDKALFVGGSYPFFRTSDVGRIHIGTLVESEDQLNEKGIKRLTLHPVGTILIPKSGASTFLDHRVLMGVDGYVSSHLATVRANPAIVDTKYLFYYLLTVEARSLGVDTAYPTLSLSQVNAIKVTLPPLPEQQRIVAILDGAFAGLATATANAEKNLKNARELFEGYLRSVFDQTKPLKLAAEVEIKPDLWEGASKIGSANSTRTGGRAATTRHIEGNRSLCVGMPTSPARKGWTWAALDGLAQMESGHTPSRRRPEYWGGDIPWMGIRDAKAAHGREIVATLENTNALGLENSSARLLPVLTVCLSRTASVGYVTIMGKPMSTSQDFVSWVCSKDLLPQFLMYLFLAQGEEIFRFSSGAVHQTIYFPEAKAFHICLPSIGAQQVIVKTLKRLREQTERLEKFYEHRIRELDSLKESILAKAFAGELTNAAPAVVIRSTASVADMRRDTALVIALAYEQHKRNNRDKSLGHTKEQKILHMVEAEAEFDLGRQPTRDAAGPNDFYHMLAAEEWAEANRYFKVSEHVSGGYHFEPLAQFRELLDIANSIDPSTLKKIERVINVFIPMNMRESEVFATVYAAWNNLLIEGKAPADDEIIRAARDEWHPNKLQISRLKFIGALHQIRRSGLVPKGKGRFVPEATQGRLPL